SSDMLAVIAEGRRVMRQASREGRERVPGLISRIAATSSLLQPYVPGRRPAAHAHTRNLALKSRNTQYAAAGSEVSICELAPLLERLSATPTLDDALHLLAAELPQALGLARVVITLDTPHVTVDSRAVGRTNAPQAAPVTVARVTRPLWLVPRQPMAANDLLETPIEAGCQRLGLLRAWAAPDEARSREALLSLLRIVCTALGLRVLLSRPRDADTVELDEPYLALASGERQRWNAFLAYVAHEVKTPLTCIQGHAQLLSRYARAARAATKTKHGTLADLLDDCERHLPALEKQVARIERLLRDALDLARSDDGGLALVLTRVNLASLVCGVAQSLEAELARAVVVDAPAALWVECDAARIEQVLGDLLRYVARGDGQERDVYMRVTEVAEGAKGGMRSARIAIWYLRAAAPNMPDCPVATTHFGTNSAASPLDLRLALSAAILRQHGGSLRLVYGSDEADGSEMVLTLPVHEAHPTPSMQTGQTGELHGTPHPRRGR
ncbi:MAG TPA: HAMP domain-containing sensor histidine kinase, partial [Ktedonobacterales bacterium]|nr:HAMP domain-containing sensor histidine kinase [Ktedonobacterales bacterium]